jgi:signal transduction histidine kinase
MPEALVDPAGSTDGWIDASAVSVVVIASGRDEGERVRGWLEGPEFVVQLASSVADALSRAEECDGSVVVIFDATVDPQHSRSLRTALARFPDRAIVAVTDDAEIDQVAAEAVAIGLHDCLARRSLSADRLQRVVRMAAARLDAHQNLHRTAADLLQANRELSDFAHILAHDLRAPVRKSRLATDRLVATLDGGSAEAPTPDADDSVAELGGVLTDELGRLEQILVSLLDYVSLKTELPEAEEFELGPVLERTIDAITAEYDLGPGVIKLLDGDGIPAVVASEVHIERVLRHLLHNAVVHHPSHDELCVEVRVSHTDDRVRLSVTDNGNGVPAHSRERVFQPVERLRADAAGPGFGLPICRRIVTSYGGSIRIAPPGQRGTVVVTELRAADRNRNRDLRTSWPRGPEAWPR